MEEMCYGCANSVLQKLKHLLISVRTVGSLNHSNGLIVQLSLKRLIIKYYEYKKCGQPKRMKTYKDVVGTF